MADVISTSGEPELTVRAVVVGALLGAVFAAGNVYVGLKTGLADNATVTAAILGFAACRTFGRTKYTTLENNITQSISSSAASMPAAMGFLGSFPALTLLGRDYPGGVLLLWGGAIGLLGIAFALPLAKRFLSDDALPFPDAIATAEVIRAMHRSGKSAFAKTRALVIAALASGAFAWFRDGKPSVLGAAYYLPLAISGVPAATLSLGIVYSPVLVSIGALMGRRTALGLFAGGVLGYVLLAPALVENHLVAEATGAALRAWLVWPGASLMIAAAVTSLARDWRLLARSARDMRALGAPGVASAFVAPGVLALATMVIGSFAFGLRLPILAASMAISVLTAVLIARSIGETATMPLGSVGRLTQLALAPATGAAVVSVLAASIPAGSGGQTGQTLETLKAGKMLGASTSRQITAQLVGALVGAPCAAGAYVMLTRAYSLGSAELPAPTASPFKVMAELIGQGTAALPPHADTASLVACALGVLLTFLERTKAARYVPSPLAMGLAFVLGAAPSFTMAAGALLLAIVARARPAWADEYGSSVAAGGLVGEALTGIVVATLLVTHVLGE